MKVQVTEPTPELIAEINAMSFTERWALTSVLLLRLEALCEKNDPEAAARLERVMQFYDAVLNGEPQSEFLLNGITNSDPIALMIARNGSESYAEAAGRMFFGDNAPNVHELKCALGA